MKKTTLAAAVAVLATGATALIATPGEAQTAPAAAANATITRAQAQAQVAAMFAKADANGDGVINQADRAAMRARMFAGLDKNSDGQLTQAELEAGRAERQAKMAERREARAERRDAARGDWFARLDTDKSGGISAAEFAAAGPARGDRAGHGGQAMNHDGHMAGGPGMGGHRMGGMGGMGGRGMGMLRMADANGDGQVTRDEASAAALKHFDMIDTNHDGQIVSAERQAAMQAMRANMAKHRGGDMMPPPADDND